MDGDAARAFRKISRTARSDSPTNLLSSCKTDDQQCTTRTLRYTHLGPLDGHEINTRLCRQRLGRQRLTTPGRTIQQDPPGRRDAQPRKRLWMRQRPLDAFP